MLQARDEGGLGWGGDRGGGKNQVGLGHRLKTEGPEQRFRCK